MKIDIREGTTDDAQLLFYWANETLTRQNSFNPNPIDWNSHICWLKKKLDNPSSKIYLFHMDKEPIGVVRFETDNNTIIGITVASEKRGQGVGAKILKLACDKFWEDSKNNILAYIKKDNVPSIRVFEKAGFTLYREDYFNDIACVILILKKQ